MAIDLLASLPTLWADADSGSAWRNMFVLALPVIEKVLRPVIVYFALVLGLRVFGKRELAQLNPFDFVVLMSLANTVQNAIIGDDTSLTGGLIGAFSLLSINYLVVRFLFGHRRLDQIIEGKPVALIDGGKVIRAALARELVTESELLTALHRQGFAQTSDVECCMLEPGGTFSITPKEPRRGERDHREVMDKLSRLESQLAELRARPANS